MQKRFITSCIVFTASAAFLITPVASAATLAEGGSAIGNSSITGKAGETKFTAANNTVNCTEVDLSGSVTANSSGTFAAEIPAGNPVFTGIGGGGDCESVGLGATKMVMNSKLCLHVPKGTDTGTITGCSGAVVTFTLSATNLGMECRYSRSSLNIEITTAANGKDAEITVVPGQLVPRESNFFCPAEGELDMEFKLTTTDGTTLVFV
jgi:hypothetical protein